MNRQKILVLGDEQHLFRTICWALEYKGYYVRLTPRPEVALALLIEQDFDLIIAKLHMEDLPSLDVLHRAKKLNPEVKIIVVSSDGNAAFPLESYRIEVEDYLFLPTTPSELVRRLGRCLEKVAAVKSARAAALEREALIRQKASSKIMIMIHDIRSGLVSTAASLKLLERCKYGSMADRAAGKVLEILNRMQDSAVILDEFAQEVLSGPGQAAAGAPVKARRRQPIKPVHRKSISESPLVR